MGRCVCQLETISGPSMVSDLKMVNKGRNAGGAKLALSSQISFRHPDDAIYIVNAIHLILQHLHAATSHRTCI